MSPGSSPRVRSSMLPTFQAKGEAVQLPPPLPPHFNPFINVLVLRIFFPPHMLMFLSVYITNYYHCYFHSISPAQVRNINMSQLYMLLLYIHDRCHNICATLQKKKKLLGFVLVWWNLERAAQMGWFQFLWRLNTEHCGHVSELVPTPCWPAHFSLRTCLVN